MVSSHRIGISAAVLFALSVGASAQLTPSAKADVVHAISDVIDRQAFVPGVDLARWPTLLNHHRREIDAAQSNTEFAGVLNEALEEFGISHIVVIPEERDRAFMGERFDDYLLQRRSQRRSQDRVGWLSNDIAYLRVNSFVESYQRQAIEDMVSEVSDSRGLVLDLRGNPGGLVDNLHHLLAMFLPNRTQIGTFVTRKTAMSYSQATKSPATDAIKIAKWGKPNFTINSRGVEPYHGKLAVLIDENSASASEIAASALRETRHASIVGSPSAGAVLMSTFEDLPHGFRLQFPISDYVSLNGQRLEANPLVPDIQLNPAETRSNDAVEVAKEELESER